MKVRAWAFLLCLGALYGAPAQDAPEITSHQEPVTFTSRVNLVSVPVVVRDSKGRAVGNLRQEDFRLFDQGKPQIISKFSVNHIDVNHIDVNHGGDRAGSFALPARALPDRYIAYVFDDIHMNFGELAQVRAAAEHHFAESIGPNSRAAIATTSGRVWLDFTNDQDKLRQTLLRIAPGPSATPPSKSAELGQRGSCPPDVDYYRADQVLNYQNPDEIRAAESAAVACFGPDPNPPAYARTVSAGVLSAGDTDTKNTFSSLVNLVRRLSTMPGSRSLILVSSGFFVIREFYQTETALVDLVIRANISLSGLDARGLTAANSAEASAKGDAMRRLARGTGGKFFEHDNGFQKGFDQLATPPEYTYVLTFSPQNLKFDGSYHRLKVSLVNLNRLQVKGLELDARPGYWAPNHAVDAAEQAKQEIREAVFSLDEVRDIPVDVTTEFFKTSDVTAQLTVGFRLDLNGLKFRTAGDRSEDTVTVVTGLFDQDGHFVKGIEKVIDLRLRGQTLSKLLGSGIADKETFDVARGRYVVRVVVRDSEGQAMAARNGTVDIQ